MQLAGFIGPGRVCSRASARVFYTGYPLTVYNRSHDVLLRCSDVRRSWLTNS